jgi:hypothetical protein
VYLNRVSATLGELPEGAESGRLAGGEPGRLLIPHLVAQEPLVQDGQVPPYLHRENGDLICRLCRQIF